MKFEKILLAVDDSDCSAVAAKAGFELARKLNAHIALIYTIELSVPVVDPYAPVMPDMDYYEIQSETAHKTLENFAQTYGQGMAITLFHPKGAPKEEILTTAKEWGANIIVMGTHGRTGLGHLLLGSISEYIVRHSKIPVLVVPLGEN